MRALSYGGPALAANYAERRFEDHWPQYSLRRVNSFFEEHGYDIFYVAASLAPWICNLPSHPCLPFLSLPHVREATCVGNDAAPSVRAVL